MIRLLLLLCTRGLIEDETDPANKLNGEWQMGAKRNPQRNIESRQSPLLLSNYCSCSKNEITFQSSLLIDNLDKLFIEQVPGRQNLAF